MGAHFDNRFVVIMYFDPRISWIKFQNLIILELIATADESTVVDIITYYIVVPLPLHFIHLFH